MVYVYCGKGKFYGGLPGVDVDTDELSTEQVAMLEVAVSQGVYRLKEEDKFQPTNKKKEVEVETSGVSE